MTMEQPTRLVHEDAEFASLVAASKRQEPPAEHIEKALSLANQITARSRWTSWRWLGTNFAIGLAVAGATAFGVVAGERALRSGAPITPPLAAAAVAPPHCAAEPCASERAGEAERAPSTSEGETSIVTVSVDDLALVPSPAVAVATRRPNANVAAPAPADNGALNLPEKAQPSSSDPDAGVARTTFVEELALVAAARSTLERGDIPSCMRAVERYQERFSAGTFADEIAVIRIEALFASGARPRARTAAEQFVAASPNSPYVDRVRSLIERSSH